MPRTAAETNVPSRVEAPPKRRNGRIRGPGNVVTMNSRVVFKDEETSESREVSLVYPKDSDPQQGRISVFAPVGAALLGLSVGQTIDWPLPQGRLKRYRVVEVVYQPEAAGHLHLYVPKCIAGCDGLDVMDKTALPCQPAGRSFDAGRELIEQDTQHVGVQPSDVAPDRFDYAFNSREALARGSPDNIS